MKTIAIVAVLLSAVACVRARTPDGKIYSCAAHNRPIPDHGGPVPTFWAGDTQYSCLGPHYDGIDHINGQTGPVAVRDPLAPAKEAHASK